MSLFNRIPLLDYRLGLFSRLLIFNNLYDLDMGSFELFSIDNIYLTDEDLVEVNIFDPCNGSFLSADQHFLLEFGG